MIHRRRLPAVFDRALWITHFTHRFGGRISPYFPKITHAAPARLTPQTLVAQASRAFPPGCFWPRRVSRDQSAGGTRRKHNDSNLMNEFWQHCSALLERELTPQQYVTWIKPLAPVAFDADANTLSIAAPNRFKLDWVKSQFSGRITDLARDFWHAPVDIQFVLDPKATARKAMGGVAAPSAASTPASLSMQRPVAEPAERSNGGHANASAHINALAAEAAQHAQSLQHNDQTDPGDLDLPSLDANEAAAARRTWRPGSTASSNGENDSAYERSKLNPVLTFDNFVT